VHVRVFDPDTTPTFRLGLRYPHGPLADHARAIGEQFEIPKTHLLKRRLRAVIASGAVSTVVGAAEAWGAWAALALYSVD
jgi:hypothetical protein